MAMTDDERSEFKALKEEVQYLRETMSFVIQMGSPALIVISQLAYVLERVSNKTFDLAEAPDEPNADRIEESFRKIRAEMDRQMELMNKWGGGDD